VIGPFDAHGEQPFYADITLAAGADKRVEIGAIMFEGAVRRLTWEWAPGQFHADGWGELPGDLVLWNLTWSIGPAGDGRCLDGRGPGHEWQDVPLRFRAGANLIVQVRRGLNDLTHPDAVKDEEPAGSYDRAGDYDDAEIEVRLRLRIDVLRGPTPYDRDALRGRP